MTWKERKRQARTDPGAREEYNALGSGSILAAEIIRLRRAKGLTQEQLARMLHTKQESIARLESGRWLPSLSTVTRLAATLGAELEIKLLPQSEGREGATLSPMEQKARNHGTDRAVRPESSASKTSARAASFRKSPIFSGLDENHLEALSRLAVELNLKAGDFLFREGEPAQSCYLVVSGMFKIVAHSTSGIDFITAIYGPGEVLGSTNLFVAKPRRSSAQAIVDTSVLSIDNGHLAAFLQQNSALRAQILEKMLTVSGRRRQAAISRLRELASERTDCRLARILLALSMALGPCIPLTRHEIAEMTGTTAETAARFISELARTGIVQSLRGKVIVKDRDRLRKLAEAS
ncbi:MAG: cyclic nucleotide-binding domain-containing protein [Chloroflexi bacterium]|nr:cyclic nucleotide-binding domain-containing protein [Chloroflexota bacterium]